MIDSLQDICAAYPGALDPKSLDFIVCWVGQVLSCQLALPAYAQPALPAAHLQRSQPPHLSITAHWVSNMEQSVLVEIASALTSVHARAMTMTTHPHLRSTSQSRTSAHPSPQDNAYMRALTVRKEHLKMHLLVR